MTDTIDTDFELLETRMNVPKVCEFPGCGGKAVNMIHNFDSRKFGKIKDTFHKRTKQYYDYIHVCGYHLQELMPYYHDRMRSLYGKGGESNIPWTPQPEFKGKRWSDPIH